MNDFAFLTNDAIGRLATVQMEEVFEKSVDGDEKFDSVLRMTKEQYKEQQRQRRIQNNPIGNLIGRIVNGEAVAVADNSHIWNLRNQIAMEIAPEIRKRQLAWANQTQN